MAAANLARPPHNSFARRLRRRYPLPPLLYAACVLEVLPVVAGLSWMMRQHGWAAVAEVTRWLWFAGSIVFLPVLAFGALVTWLASKASAVSTSDAPRKTLTSLLAQGVLSAATTGSLLVGRTDWAIAAWYGGSALNNAWHHLRFGGASTWRNAARAVFRGLLLLTVLSGWPELFAAAAFLSLWVPVLFKPSTAALVAEKRSREEFARLESEQRRGDPFGQLRLWCEAELWDEALEQHRKLSAEKEHSADQLAEYLARIYIGRGQFAEVLRLNDRAEALIPRVEAYLQLGQEDRARQIAERAFAEKKPGASFAMGAVCEAAGDLEEALIWYERQAFHWRSTREVPPVRSAARVLMNLGDYREARILLELAIQRSRFLPREEVQSLAECLRKLGKQELAGRVEAALRRCPEVPPPDLQQPSPAPASNGSTRKSRRACPRQR